MKKAMFFTVLCMIILHFQACKPTVNKKTNDPFTEGTNPVKALYLSSIEAFNQNDLELFLANFAPEIKMYGTDGTYFGHDALRARFAVLFKQFPNMKMEIPELTSEILSDEVILVHFKWKLYPLGHGPAYSGIGSGVYTYRDGKWLEVLEVETITDVDEALKQPN
jgi:uncharacterized protein (TIGR02246 family)